MAEPLHCFSHSDFRMTLSVLLSKRWGQLLGHRPLHFGKAFVASCQRNLRDFKTS